MVDAGTVLLLAFALVLGAIVLLRHRDRLGEVKAVFLKQGSTVLLRIPIAFLVATSVGRLIPPENIAPLIGGESGFSGVLLACLLGGLIPGGPSISFPLALIVWTMGAGTVQMVAFLAAWSCYALHRVLSYEWALMGPKFVMVRLCSVFVLPPVAALMATGLLWSVERTTGVSLW